MDTGPSVFINAHIENTSRIAVRFQEMGFKNVIASKVGQKPFLTGKHLF
jgi:mevalonate pyrophosphate decarboxylase